MAAHRPEEVLCAAESPVFGGREQADFDQFAGIADLVDVFANPVKRMQIAQTALAFLDIGFDHVAAVAQFLVPLVALGQFLGDELAFGAGDDFGPEAPRAFFIKRAVTPDIAAFKECRADRQIAARHAHHFVERAARLADLESEVPEEIEHGLDHLLAPGRGLGRGEKGDIDIRMRGHLAAPVSADRNECDAFAGRPVAGAVDMADHVIVDHADQLVDQESLPLRAFGAVRGLLAQAAREFLTPLGKCLAQQFDDSRTRLVAFRADALGNGIGKRPAIDDGALVGNPGGDHTPRLYPIRPCASLAITPRNAA